MKKLIEFLLVFGLVTLFAMPALSKSKGEAKLKFSGQTMARVDFTHESHKEYVSNCKECHHMGVGTGGCVDCHGGDSRARSKKSAFHDSCMGCHAEKGVSTAGDCNFCHKG
ncbi:MAG: cytochrome c3 family protein [Desulfuromonadales bacterium]|nr:cytochrome c3 family protein [Desulfuromonadales bacterium]